MTKTLDDVGEAIGKVGERFDAFSARRRSRRDEAPLHRHGRRDGYLSSEPVPTDKTLHRTDGDAAGYVTRLKKAEETQNKDGMNIVLRDLQGEALSVLSQVMNDYAMLTRPAKNRAEAVREIEKAFIRNCRFANKTK
jgi:hypothetical protein